MIDRIDTNKMQSMQKYPTLKLLYLFMFIIYAARPINSFSTLEYFNTDSIITLILPMAFTIVMLNLQPIKFKNKQLWISFLVVAVWLSLQLIFKGEINAQYSLYLFYQLFYTFILIKMYGYDIFPLYEKIVYPLIALSLVLWSISVIAPGILAAFMHLFRNGTKISEGSIIVYTMMLLSKVNGIIRNAGFAWEPGRFSCFISLALYIRFLINGYNLKDKRVVVYLLAYLTTQSTTGFFLMAILMLSYAINKPGITKFFAAIVFLVAAVYLYQVNWVGGKLDNSLERADNAGELVDARTEYHSLDRMESLVLDWDNFLHDPILGFGERSKSYYGDIFSFPGGLMSSFARFGIILCLLYYLFTLRSAKRLSRLGNDKMIITYFLLFLGMQTSYAFTNNVLFMAFNFMSLYGGRETLVFMGRKQLLISH